MTGQTRATQTDGICQQDFRCVLFSNLFDVYDGIYFSSSFCIFMRMHSKLLAGCLLSVYTRFDVESLFQYIADMVQWSIEMFCE